MIKKIEVYKLNYMSTIIFVEEDKKKLTSYRSLFKRSKDLICASRKLEISISTFKSDLDKTTLSLQRVIAQKSKLDEILVAQIIENKYQGLEFAKHLPRSTLAPNTLKAALMTLFVKVIYAKRVKTSPSIAISHMKNKHATKESNHRSEGKSFNTKAVNYHV